MLRKGSSIKFITPLLESVGKSNFGAILIPSLPLFSSASSIGMSKSSSARKFSTAKQKASYFDMKDSERNALERKLLAAMKESRFSEAKKMYIEYKKINQLREYSTTKRKASGPNDSRAFNPTKTTFTEEDLEELDAFFHNHEDQEWRKGLFNDFEKAYDDLKFYEDRQRESNNGTPHDEFYAQEGQIRNARSIRRRRGRPFIDPAASRVIPEVRADPHNKEFGLMIGDIEHDTYCNAQREEEPTGFFFDTTRPNFDSDCDGDAFAANYLSEDEYDVNPHYKVQPYVSDAVAEEMVHLYKDRKWPVSKLCQHFRTTPARLSAHMFLRMTQGPSKRSNSYTTMADEQLEDFYRGRFLTYKPSVNPTAQFVYIDENQQFAKAGFLRNDPTKFENRRQTRLIGIKPLSEQQKIPKRKERGIFHSKISCRFISSDKSVNKKVLVVSHSDYAGKCGPAPNKDEVFRSWIPRGFTVDQIPTDDGLPYRAEDANKPAQFTPGSMKRKLF